MSECTFFELAIGFGKWMLLPLYFLLGAMSVIVIQVVKRHYAARGEQE